MDSVMLIELMDSHGRSQFCQRFTGVGDQCRIGRSLACNIVLDDTYAAAEHTLLTLQADGRVHVQDLGTHNGTRIDGERVPPEHGEFITQGTLIVGRSRLRVRTLTTALPPERIFRRDLLRRYRTAMALVGLLLCLGFAVFSQWLNAPEHAVAATLTAVLITTSGLALWAGLWSLISKLNHGAWQVRIHLAIVANCVALCAWGYWLYRLMSFATQWRWLGPGLTTCAIFVALVMVYLHLRNATNMQPRHAMAIASVATLAMSGASWLIDLYTDARDVNRVAQGPAVYPSAIRIAPSMDVTDYLSDAAALKRAANRNRQASLTASPLLDADE